MTHYLPYFTQYRLHQQRAACGVFIEEKDHSPEPSCPQCLAWIQQGLKDTEAIVMAEDWRVPYRWLVRPIPMV